MAAQDTIDMVDKGTPIVEVKNLVKTYGKGDAAFTALGGVDLTIRQGEVVAIIGKSGSGKSTLMHLLALLDQPTSGEIRINGNDTAGLKRREIDTLRNTDFGFVFQQFFLNADESVLNNVILPLKIAGVPSSERKQRGLEVLKAVELEDKADNKAVDLSGGQKQRVAIARALINKPKVIFADEPTGNLDTATGDKIEDLLFSLNQEQGITVIFVTHDPELAQRCQRQIMIKDGHIEGATKS
ncbi:MAG TPA: ABC transporter ATP-binding protein [Candidatus Saccharimonadales bacterium]|jgi:putative ABC transport system ATP-binding protein